MAIDEATTSFLATLAESGAKPFTQLNILPGSAEGIGYVVAQLGPVFAAGRSEGS